MSNVNSLKQIEIILEELLPTLGTVDELQESCSYSVIGGGKRIRPRIALAVASDLLRVNSSTEIYQKFGKYACALELLHCSSLIHDDLPCMDNDDFRRGKPSNHKKFSESQALLTGDALVAMSFVTILRSEFLNEIQKNLLSLELGKTYIELCNGQLWDLSTKKRDENLLDIHLKKTASLFATSFKFGSIFANCNQEIQSSFYQLGIDVGILFQMLDDYLDIYGDPQKRGRPSGSDLKNGRTTAFTSIEQSETKNKLDYANQKALKSLELTKKLSHNNLTFTSEILTELIENNYLLGLNDPLSD